MANPEFNKYKSIENSYNARYITGAVNRYPELTTAKIQITEKLDGANIQLLFRPNQPMLVGKRTSWLNEGDDFFDIWNTLKKYQYYWDRIQEVVNIHKEELKFVGEIYGPGINGRVDYGQEKQIALFDFYQGGVRHYPIIFKIFATVNGFKDLLAPELAVVDGIMEALKYETETMKRGETIAEGVVLRGYHQNYDLGNGEILIIKKKNLAFAEVEQQKHKVKSLDKYQTDLLGKQLQFADYITESRLLSVISKLGELKDMKQMGEYIKALMEDATTDFIKDTTDPDKTKYEEKDLKFITSSGNKKAALLCRNHIVNQGAI